MWLAVTFPFLPLENKFQEWIKNESMKVDGAPVAKPDRAPTTYQGSVLTAAAESSLRPLLHVILSVSPAFTVAIK